MFGLSYWFLPLFAGTVWLGTLAGMMGWWIAQGTPIYSEEAEHQHIAYISDIGATRLKPLFIAGSTTMVVVFDLAFLSERWLRHKNRLTPDYTRTEAWLSVCAIVAAIIGAAGLILLSIFDTKHYHTVHDTMLGVFIGGYVVSAIFICAEYQRLGIHFREHRVLRISFWIKLVFILVEIILAVAFGVTQYYKKWNVAAVLEWTISLIYIFYVWSFIIDFLPARHTKRPDSRFPPVRRQADHIAEKRQHDGNMLGGPVYSGGGHENGVNGNGYVNDDRAMEAGRYYQPNAQQPSRNF